MGMISEAEWNAANLGPVVPTERCFVGVELTRRAAVVAYYFLGEAAMPDQVRWTTFVPAAHVGEDDRAGWAGRVEVTPGDVVDLEAVAAELRSRPGRIEEVAYDPWLAASLAARELPAPAVPLRPSFASLAGPTADLLERLSRGLLNHGGDPLAATAALETELQVDVAGNCRPAGRSSAPIRAMVFAYARAMASRALRGAA